MKSVATHHGSFHADDVFAVAMLKLIYPEIKVIRTRDPEVYGKADARVDVGMKYNPDTNDFDHHQPEGAGERNGIPYASAGLVWKHVGMKLANSEEAFAYIDERLLQPIDAADNGMSTFEATKGAPFVISDVVSLFNPSWKDDVDFDTAFGEAVEFATTILSRMIQRANGLKEAEDIVLEAIENSPKEYIILETYCPWKRTAANHSDAKFIVYQNNMGGWNVQAIPLKEEGFESRQLLPEEWAGLTGEEFAKVSGVPDVVFCHRGRFIAGAKSKEGAIALVRKAL